MNDVTWEYQCLFGFKHRWTKIVGNVRIVVEYVSGHLAKWTAYDKDSWETIFKSFRDLDTSYETPQAAMAGAELWLTAP